MGYLDNDELLFFWQQIKTKFAKASHTHAIADTTGLQAALDGKAAVGHKHTIVDVDGLQAELDAKAAVGHKHALVTQVTDGNLTISIE